MVEGGEVSSDQLSIDLDEIFEGREGEGARMDSEDSNSIGEVVMREDERGEDGQEMTCSVCYESLKELAEGERK